MEATPFAWASMGEDGKTIFTRDSAEASAWSLARRPVIPLMVVPPRMTQNDVVQLTSEWLSAKGLGFSDLVRATEAKILGPRPPAAEPAAAPSAPPCRALTAMLGALEDVYASGVKTNTPGVTTVALELADALRNRMMELPPP